MNKHIVTSFDTDLASLDRKIAEMGGLCEELLGEAFEALAQRDPKRAEQVVARDKEIDALERSLQEDAILMIARRQPMANDLRHVMTVIKIAGDLERIGDLAKNIAKRASVLAQVTPPKSLVIGLEHMTDSALTQLKDVLDAYASNDADKAMTVWRDDARLDSLYNSLFREMLTYMMEDPRDIGLCTHLMFGAKNLERIGDHTTNIAENVHYLVRGALPAEARPKSDETSSLAVSPNSGSGNNR